MNGMLGQLSNELEPDEFISHFMALGAKAYRYETSRGVVKQRHKGISMKKNIIPKDVYESLVKTKTSIEMDQLRITNYGNVMGTAVGFKKKIQSTNDKRDFFEDQNGNIVSRPLITTQVFEPDP
jgi:hypothetical protein